MDRFKKIQGVLRLDFYKNGKHIHTDKGYNLIVDTGYHALLSALSGNSDKQIAKVQCGSNGNDPAPTDTVITDSVDLPITSFEVAGKSLILTFELDENHANGDTIAEFGTICGDGTLFSRKNYKPFLKTPDLSIIGTWTFNI
jgi:hypothetical protein